jgi:hypothetical protein
MKVLIISFVLFLSFPLVVLGDDEPSQGIQTDYTKPYVGFNMPLSSDIIQTDSTCNKKPFYFGGTSTDWLNSDKTDISSVLYKTQEK